LASAIVTVVIIAGSGCGGDSENKEPVASTPSMSVPGGTTGATTMTVKTESTLSTRQVALEETTKCLQSIPLLKVDTSGGPLADLDVHADLQAGGGNAMITVFPTHAGAEKYAHTFNAGAVGNLAGLIYNYKGSQDFQAAVEGCLR
jgi:hypothetical protein